MQVVHEFVKSRPTFFTYAFKSGQQCVVIFGEGVAKKMELGAAKALRQLEARHDFETIPSRLPRWFKCRNRIVIGDGYRGHAGAPGQVNYLCRRVRAVAASGMDVQ